MKTFSINFTKSSKKFCLNLHYNNDNSYLFVNDFGSVSDGFGATESREVSLNGNV